MQPSQDSMQKEIRHQDGHSITNRMFTPKNTEKLTENVNLH